MAEQRKIDCDTGSGKTGGKTVPRKKKHKEISSRDLHEFEDLSQAIEKCFGKMALASSASAAAADESTSSEESDNDSSSAERKSQKKEVKRNLKPGKTAKIASHVVWQQLELWLYSELSMGYVSKNVSYDKLTLEEFVAGYSAILLLPQTKQNKQTKQSFINHKYK